MTDQTLGRQVEFPSDDDKAEDMLSEDTEGERSSDQGTSPQQDTDRLEMNEVRNVKSQLL